MLQWHQREECAAVAGAILNGNPESGVSWASYMTEFSEYTPVGKPRYQAIGVTANLSYKRWVFEKYGGFNETLKQYVDTEFNCRLNAGGDKLLFVPNILVKHKHRTTLGAYLKHETGRGRSALALRRHGYLSYNSVANSRWLCVMVSGIVLVKLVLGNIRRFSRARILPLGKTVRIIPISILGSLAWTVGFLSESMKPTIQLPEVGARSVKSETIPI
jgi:GT2 family glycosyltransferase